MTKQFLNINDLKTIILCFHCRTPLWKLKILKHQDGQVMSSEYERITPDVPKYSDKVPPPCPKCGNHFFRGEGEKRKVLCRDPKTGISFTL